MPDGLPQASGVQLARAFQRSGWRRVAQKGSHAKYRHPDRTGSVTIPIHAGKSILPGTLRSILAQAGLTADDLKEMLWMAGSSHVVILTPESDGSAYSVTIPALPGCLTWGETVEQALENAREAISIHLSDEPADATMPNTVETFVATVTV